MTFYLSRSIFPTLSPSEESLFAFTMSLQPVKIKSTSLRGEHMSSFVILHKVPLCLFSVPNTGHI